MSQKLMSAEFYQEPSEDEVLAEVKENLRSKSSLRLAKYFLNVAFWVTVVGGGAFLFHRAVGAATQPKSYSGSGARPPVDMMAFWMSLVDWEWGERFEDGIRSKRSPHFPTPDISDTQLPEPPPIDSTKRPYVPSN
jgi:hypothetical protein